MDGVPWLAWKCLSAKCTKYTAPRFRKCGYAPQMSLQHFQAVPQSSKCVFLLLNPVECCQVPSRFVKICQIVEDVIIFAKNLWIFAEPRQVWSNTCQILPNAVNVLPKLSFLSSSVKLLSALSSLVKVVGLCQMLSSVCQSCQIRSSL